MRQNQQREQQALQDQHTQAINTQRDTNHQEILALVQQQQRSADEVENLNKVRQRAKTKKKAKKKRD